MKKPKLQTELFLDVLKLLQEKDILKDILLIGSWCMFFYKELFPKEDFSILRTRDIDFLIPLPFRSEADVDIQAILEDLGFLLDFHADGSMSFLHPELMIDFLVSEKGSPKDKPVPIKQLHINAQALHFLDILLIDPVPIRYQDTKLNIPNPVRFALHKILVSTKRKKKEKAERDFSQGIEILTICQKSPKFKETIPSTFKSFHPNQQKDIRGQLEKLGEKEILKLLSG